MNMYSLDGKLENKLSNVTLKIKNIIILKPFLK
jgi:hypothetical protein